MTVRMALHNLAPSPLRPAPPACRMKRPDLSMPLPETPARRALVRWAFLCSLAGMGGSLGAVEPTAEAGAAIGASAAPVPVAASASAAAAASAVSAYCAEFARRLPNVSDAQCRAAHLLPTGAVSVQGRPILQRDVRAAGGDEPGASAPRAAAPSRRVLVVGGIHGDELSSASLVLHWIAHAERDGGDMQWRLVPLMNPDGVFRERPTRTNANGVDLNRNFPTPDWAQLAPRYWKERTNRDPRRFPGHKPLSEPETRWLHDEMQRFKPHLIVSVHAPYGVLDFDGPSVPPQRLGRLYLDRVGIFPGSLGNYGGVHKNVPVVTIELSSAIRTPTDAEMRQMWLDLLRWIDERLPPEGAAPLREAPVSADCMNVPRPLVAVSGVVCLDRPADENKPERPAPAPAARPPKLPRGGT